MFKVCKICGKDRLTGKKVTRKGQLKSKGGTGSKIVRANKRVFLPNLQKIRIVLNGRPQQAYVCTKCLKKGNIIKV